MTTTLGLVKAITTTFKYMIFRTSCKNDFRNRSSTSKVSHQNSLRAVWCGLSWATTYFGVVGLIHIMFDEQQNRGGLSWSSRDFGLAFNMQKSARCKNAVKHTVFTHRHKSWEEKGLANLWSRCERPLPRSGVNNGNDVESLCCRK